MKIDKRISLGQILIINVVSAAGPRGITVTEIEKALRQICPSTRQALTFAIRNLYNNKVLMRHPTETKEGLAYVYFLSDMGHDMLFEIHDSFKRASEIVVD